jgi:hypothetical protein
MERRVSYEFTEEELWMLRDGLELLEEKYKFWVDDDTNREAAELRWSIEEVLER